jgi:hypothetical protein
MRKFATEVGDRPSSSRRTVGGGKAPDALSGGGGGVSSEAEPSGARVSSPTPHPAHLPAASDDGPPSCIGPREVGKLSLGGDRPAGGDATRELPRWKNSARSQLRGGGGRIRDDIWEVRRCVLADPRGSRSRDSFGSIIGKTNRKWGDICGDGRVGGRVDA